MGHEYRLDRELEGSDDLRSYACDVGQILVFDGVNLLHGNKLNETGKTRVEASTSA